MMPPTLPQMTLLSHTVELTFALFAKEYFYNRNEISRAIFVDYNKFE